MDVFSLRGALNRGVHDGSAAAPAGQRLLHLMYMEATARRNGVTSLGRNSWPPAPSRADAKAAATAWKAARAAPYMALCAATAVRIGEDVVHFSPAEHEVYAAFTEAEELAFHQLFLEAQAARATKASGWVAKHVAGAHARVAEGAASIAALAGAPGPLPAGFPAPGTGWPCWYNMPQGWGRLGLS